MKLTNHEGLRAGGVIGLLLMELCLMGMGIMAHAQSFSTTTVQGTVYLANGQPGTGTLVVSWPSFTTANGQVVAADSMTVAIAPDGFVSVSLAPNQGASPAGLYYTATFYMSDGSVNTQYWVVPAATSATLGQVQARLMPSTQAVQAVSKTYVDQAIAQLSGSLLTASGGTLSGPLTLCCDPTTPLQAADKHYVDAAAAQAVPLTGGTLSGPLTATKLGALYQVDQFAGADFGAKLSACLSGLSSTNGGTCDARNFSGTLSMGANLTISTANATVLLPCATISTANQVMVTAGTRNVSLRGCTLRGASAASGSQGGTIFYYSGAGAMVQVGDPTYAADTQGFHLDNVAINITAATSASAQGLAAYRTQELDLESLYFLGNSNQKGMTLDGTGNYTGGTFYDNQFTGFQTAVNAIGHQIANAATTDWVNASTFVRLHIDCPTSSGSPISGTYGINLQQGNGNTFTGGDVEGCSTALHLGANAQNNTIVGLRNENSANQIVADAGSSYNLWITGGTMFTGKLTDNGTHNSFTDSFHRAWNNLNGDLWRSQADTTVINRIYTGIGLGNVRGRQDEWQTDVPGSPGTYQNAWQWGPGDGTSGAQVWELLDMLNNVPRFGVIQYTTAGGNNQSFLNGAGTGSVCVQCSTGAGSGGFVIGSGGPTITTVASVDHQGDAQFQGTLQTAGNATFGGTTRVYNQADGEIDSILQAGLTAEQKESFIYRDHIGASQWYMVKDQNNNWALNSATGGLDSFKAYQSTNSGDTYIDASNSSGAVRINYETGSGTQFKVYGGNSSSLYAAFTGTTAIQFPGLAASSGHNCLQVDNSGYVTNTGSACGTGSSNGTVNSGTSGQIAYYNGTGTVLSGTSTVSITAGGTGASTPSGALTNLGGAPLTGASFTGPVSVSSTLSAENITSIGPRYDVTNPAFGAKGDGSTDDTMAIQAAFTTCWSSGGGIVEFPGPHSYVVSSTINAFDGCQIEGTAASSSGGYIQPQIEWAGAASATGTVYNATGFTLAANTSIGTAAFPLLSSGTQNRIAPYIATVTAANSLAANQWVELAGFSTTAGLGLNRCIGQVASATSTSFVLAVPCALQITSGSFTDTGTASTVSVVIAFDANARYQQAVSNISIASKTSVAANPFNVGILFGSRVDTGTRLVNTQVASSLEYGYYFAGGGINTEFDKGWRGDSNQVAAIYWRVGGSDSFGIANGTVDNDICDGCTTPTSGAAVMLDNSACLSNANIHFTSRNVKVEANTSLTPGLGAFTLLSCPSNGNLLQFFLNFDSTWVSPAGTSIAGFNAPSIVVSPADDAALVMSATNSEFSAGTGADTTVPFVGVPALSRNSLYGGTGGWFPALFYAPSLSSGNFYSGLTRSPIQLLGDVNIGQLWQDGVQASAFLYSDTGFAAMPNGTTLYAGQILAPPGYWSGSNGKRYATDVVYQTGTTGTPNSGATTCTGSSGTSVLTCNSATDLSAGQNISIGTDINKQIKYIDATQPSAVLVNLHGNLGSTYSSATALTFSAPVLGPEIQFPTKSSAAPTTMAWSQGDMEQNSTATANGVAAWVNVAAGTPGTWAGIPLGNSSGQISPAQISSTTGSGSVVLATSPTIASPTFSGTVTTPLSTAGVVTTTSGGVLGSQSLPTSAARLATNSSGQIVAASNTLGCLDGYDHLPCTVYIQPLVSESSGTGSYATVWTTTSAGIYQISGYTYGTSCGTTSSGSATATQYVEAVQNGGPTAYGATVSSAQVGNTSGQCSSGTNVSVTYNLAANTAVKTESLLSVTATGAVWSRGVQIIRLQ
ncbi:MAG TPA: hypothetical protein VGE85_09505 [Terracidiphilus sp.]|jgi:hypothetical protein